MIQSPLNSSTRACCMLYTSIRCSPVGQKGGQVDSGRPKPKNGSISSYTKASFSLNEKREMAGNDLNLYFILSDLKRLIKL